MGQLFTVPCGAIGNNDTLQTEIVMTFSDKGIYGSHTKLSAEGLSNATELLEILRSWCYISNHHPDPFVVKNYFYMPFPEDMVSVSETRPGTESMFC